MGADPGRRPAALPGTPPLSVPREELRASDADREQVAAALREHCAAGRLSVDELTERLHVALSAVTLGELDRLTRDLPTTAPPSLPEARRRPVVPGMRAFEARIEGSAPREEATANVLARLAPLLSRCGYQLVSRDADSVVFEREQRPGWTYAVAVGVPGLGLLALLHRERRRIVVAVTDRAAGGTLVTLYGVAPLGLRQALAELED
ncbi:MAG TPA: DUF1707 domain-containing protein [Gaiellaceae bacterium]